MTLGYPRMTDTVVLPGRLGGDLLSGMWAMMARLGRVPRRLVWDRESAIAGGGKPTALAAAFFETLGVTATIAPPRKDPEFKGSSSAATGSWRPRSCPAGCSARSGIWTSSWSAG
jgi:hypothetical protein